jgi:hypothetical protein
MSAPTRRALLALSGVAIAAGGIVGATVATPALADEHPDAELIALCAQHIVNMNAYNADRTPEQDVDENEALWAAYSETRDAISDAKPQTIAGMVAIAQAAMAEAGPDNQDADDRCFHGMDEHWSWNLVGDLLRLHGEALT